MENTINPGQNLDPMFDTKLSWCPGIWLPDSKFLAREHCYQKKKMLYEGFPEKSLSK